MRRALEDFVSISRLWGNTYLWEDPLCMVQADCEEYKGDPLKMADKYSNTKLVLSGQYE